MVYNRHYTVAVLTTTDVTRSLAVAETVRLLHWAVLAKYNWKTIFGGNYRSILNYWDVIRLQSYRIR